MKGRFDTITKKYSQRSAIYFDGVTLTYEDLHQQSQIITKQILEYTRGKTYPIAFRMERGPKAVITILSIIQADCYYVPLDVAYPIDRQNYIINDIEPFLILTNDLEIPHDKYYWLNNAGDDIYIFGLRETVTVQPSVLDQIAYVIYTSGSTGAPKGVIIKQSSLINLIDSAIRIFKFEEIQRVLHYTSIGFDASGWDIYIALFSGGTLYIATDEIALNPLACHQFIDSNEITMATVTPAFLSQMPMTPIKSLQTLVVMGDLSDTKYMDWWSESANANIKVYNGYGPTECTIGSTIHLYSKGDNPRNVGVPFDGYDIYILDGDLNPTSADSDGEICISGKGVAVGYHNLPDKTAEKFVQFRNSRIYRTGDMGRFTVGGTLEFLGRIDNQIKINGIRIELEEIEYHVMKMELIARACCVWYDQKICLFYQSKEPLEDKTIRSHLKTKLHRTVIPSFYFHVDKFELTHNGKIDRKLLCEKISENNIGKIINRIIEAYAIVLNLEKNLITPESDFFVLGGHSLIVYKVVSYLQTYHLIKAIDIMNFPIVSELAKQINSVSEPGPGKIEVLPTQKSSEKYMETNLIPISPLQMTLWKHHLIYPADASYNTLKLYSINYPLHTIQTNITKLIKSHPALLTKFISSDGEIYQKFDNTIFIFVKMGLKKNQVMDDVKTILKQPFNLESEQFIRVGIYPIKDNEVILSIIKEGSIIDAYSENILERELFDMFSGKKVEPRDNYIGAVGHLCNEFESDRTKCKIFWKDYLKAPFDNQIPRSLTDKLSHFKINIKLHINLIATKLKTTPYVIAISAMGLMLRHYFDNSDVIFGTQIAIRDDPLYTQTVGFFVSTVLLRINFDMLTLFAQIHTIHQNYLNVYKNKNVTYDKLLQIWGRSVDVMFVYQNLPVLSETPPEINVRRHDMVTSAPFPITWYTYQTDSDLTIEVKTYHDFEMINHMICTFRDFLFLIEKYALTNMNVTISSEFKCKPVVLEGRYTQNPNSSVDQYISSICTKYSDGIALRFSSEYADHLDKSMTYAELGLCVNQCAMFLNSVYDIGPRSRVVLALRKSVDFVIILLAVLKTGASYIPIDPDYPIDRIQYMITDSTPQMIITRYVYKIDFNHGCVVDLDLVILEARQNNINPLFESKSTSDSLAYIIYTSGSTGNPKACMVTHKSIFNVCKYFEEQLVVTPTDKIWTHTTISFDIVILELFLPLFSGASLLICPQCVVSNPVEHVGWINRHMPTIIQATPTQFSLIARHLKSSNSNSLQILVGGEQLNTQLAEILLKLTPNVYNVYGPSETTIWSTISIINDPHHITIGHPIANTTCMVLNSSRIPVPSHVVGELYIGGIGVSMGYYDKPEMSADRFVELPDNLTLSNKTKFYRTGDLVKIIGGEIIYVGRNDFQLKIRGHRVELEEIIRIADSYENIHRSCLKIFDQNNGVRHIVLYVISFVSLSISQMFEYMRLKLPKNHMPSFIIQLPRFPETLNGKIDTKFLPNPFTNSLIRYTYQNHYVGPRTLTEKRFKVFFVAYFI